MKSIVHNYDKAVFGSNMHAMMFAYVNQLPLFYSSLDNKPKLFEFFEPQYSFSTIPNVNKILSNNEEKHFGMKKSDLWQSLSLIHSLEGLMPLGNNVVSARLDENTLKFTTKNSKIINVKFNHLYMFDENIEGLPETIKFNNSAIVYDYFEFNSLHEYKTMFIETNELFSNFIYMNKKSGVVVSIVEDLNEEIPDYAVRFKILELAKQYGIKGKQNGIYHYKKELKIPRFLKLDVKLIKREIRKTLLNDYTPTNHLTFLQSTDILMQELFQKIEPNRIWNLLRLPHPIQKRDSLT